MSFDEFANFLQLISPTKDFITYRLDSDDYMHPELLESVKNKLIEEYSNYDIVIAGPKDGYIAYGDDYYKYTNDKIAIGMGMISNCDHCLYSHPKIAKILGEKYTNKKIIHTNIKSSPRTFIYNRTSASHSFYVKGQKGKAEVLKKQEVDKLKKDFKMK
jgi:AhpD family alkylhydroperoxidase